MKKFGFKWYINNHLFIEDSVMANDKDEAWIIFEKKYRLPEICARMGVNYSIGDK